MKVKITALALSALLPLSVWAMPEHKQQAMQKHSAEKYEQNTEWRKEKMQKRQEAWFDRLDLTPEQREAFQSEMQQHREQQQKSRQAHHDKLRTLLNDEQRAAFDKDTEKMQKRMQDKMKNYMQKDDKAKRTGEGKRNSVKE